jgi:hypothetical protein
MGKSFLQRRFESPDYDLEVFITGVRLGDSGKVRWHVAYDEGYDPLLVSDILECATEVLRDK